MQNDKLIQRLVYSLTVVIILAVIVLNRRLLTVPETFPAFIYKFPAINAIINGLCSVLLVTSLYYIKKKNILMHKRLNVATFVLSSVFLVQYVVYHYFVEETKFGGEGPIRYIYYTLLISHIILAAVVLPLILFSFQRGLNMDIPRHKAIVRWSFPIWLYVTITGVLVYLMISPYYKF